MFGLGSTATYPHNSGEVYAVKPVRRPRQSTNGCNWRCLTVDGTLITVLVRDAHTPPSLGTGRQRDWHRHPRQDRRRGYGVAFPVRLCCICAAHLAHLVGAGRQPLVTLREPHLLVDHAQISAGGSRQFTSRITTITTSRPRETVLAIMWTPMRPLTNCPQMP